MFALLLVCLLVALLAQGYARQRLGSSSTQAATTSPRAGLASSGAVLDLSGRQVVSVHSPSRTIALTFDDGPDPTWTPRILDVLHRYHVPATFFVVGSQVVARPGLVNRELKGGNEVGSHTFTHADLAALPGWRRSLELNLTQTVLAGTSGVHTALLRPPYSSVPSALTVADYRALRATAGQGYLAVLADRDSEDWRRQGVAPIVARALPSGSDGAVVLFHDGGGDRGETVAALGQIIPLLQSRGDRFVTVSTVAGLAHSPVARVSTAAHLQGLGLVWGLEAAFWITRMFVWLAIPVAVLALARAVMLAFFARRHARRAAGAIRPTSGPPASIIVPAFNEEVGIAAAVRSLMASDYGDFEVIVVDDGSVDGTADIVDALDEPRVTLIRQENAGKAAALNRGIDRARHDLIVTVDADTVFERDTLSWLLRPFADPRVGAVSGNTKVGNRRGMLGTWQHIEYVIGFNLDRRLYDLLDCMPTVPGAGGAFRRAALIDAGGVPTETLAEDTDLTMAVNRAGWRIVYEERARTWTEAPSTLSALWRQRYRWSYGTMQAVWKHRAALWRRSEGGRLGRIGLPYLILFQILFPLLAPVVDIFALYGLLFLNSAAIAAYWVGFNALSLAVGAYAFHLDHERYRPLWALPLQQVVYRQVMYLVIVQSVVSAALGSRLRWHKLHRTGDIAVPAAR